MSNRQNNFIVQVATIDGESCTSQQRFAIAKVKEKYPNETEELEPITAGGVLAPDQAIALDQVALNRCYHQHS